MRSTLSCIGIIDFANTAYIICHNENIAPLCSFLSSQGFRSVQVRGPYTEEQNKFTAIMKCLVNHSNAWRLIVASGKPGLIVEADFVPVLSFSSLPLPVPPGLEDISLSYLYSCGPEYWDLANGYTSARGHAGAAVAYVISAQVAALMLEYYEDLMVRNPAGLYHTWDCEIGYWLKSRGVQTFISLKNYGEHGGKWNPEHIKAGLRRPHRADVLVSPLAFLPFYATSVRNFYLTRVGSFLYGLARLFCGRLISLHNIRRRGGRRLLAAGVRRFNPFAQVTVTLGSRRLYSCNLASK